MLSAYLLHLAGEGCSANYVTLNRRVVRAWEGSGLEAVEYLAALDSNLRLSTRRLYGRLLKCYLAFQVRTGRLPENPLADFRFGATLPEPIRPLSRDEIGRLLEACAGPSDRMAVLMLYGTGLRASEFCGLRPANVCAEAGTLRVTGKGNKVRLLAVTGETLALLQRWARTGRPAIPKDRQALYRMVRRIGKAARIEGLHPHVLRHTFSDQFLESGGRIEELKLLLGHSSLTTTWRYINHREAERALAAHRRFLEGLPGDPLRKCPQNG
jgi:integrase